MLREDQLVLVSVRIGAGTALDRCLPLHAKSEHARSDALWGGGRGSPTASCIAQLLNGRPKAAGLGGINSHRMRHTSVSRWLEGGGSEGGGEELFGWTDARMIYKVYGKSTAVERAHKAARRSSLGHRL